MTDETPRKGEHRERQGLLVRARDRFERMEPKRQALLLAVAAVIALAATIALNPFQSTTSDQPEPQSAQQATDSGKDTKNQSRTDPSSEPSGFTGSTEDIANKVRSILNSPDGGNIDTFGQTLIRHGDKDLGNATDLFDAIGRQDLRYAGAGADAETDAGTAVLPPRGVRCHCASFPVSGMVTDGPS